MFRLNFEFKCQNEIKLLHTGQNKHLTSHSEETLRVRSEKDLDFPRFYQDLSTLQVETSDQTLHALLKGSRFTDASAGMFFADWIKNYIWT